jgi:hypothetical protein
VIDVTLLAMTWLMTDPLNGEANPVLALLNSMFTTGGASPNDTPNRVYDSHLPVGFDAKYGPGIVVRVGVGTATGTTGGSAHPEAPILNPRLQLTVYGLGNYYSPPRQVYRAIFDWMHQKTNVDLGAAGYVLSCLEQVEGQAVADPHTGQATIVSYWQLRALAN